MRFRQILTAGCLLSIVFVTTGSAQVKRLTLRSDFPPKSVVLSDINQELGKKSPFLVAATVKENGAKKEYRSLLQFNFDYLPEYIRKDPQMIGSAYLVLFPANGNYLKNTYNEPCKLVVKRIVENWYDSLIAWDNQPSVDSLQVSSLRVVIKKRDWEVRVDVTSLLKDMLLYGNNGFMISQNNGYSPDSLTGFSFASSLNNDKKLRPLLMITFNDNSTPANNWDQRSSRPVSTPVYTPPRAGPSSSSGNSNKSE